jgi:hypothetical protein
MMDAFWELLLLSNRADELSALLRLDCMPGIDVFGGSTTVCDPLALADTEVMTGN